MRRRRDRQYPDVKKLIWPPMVVTHCLWTVGVLNLLNDCMLRSEFGWLVSYMPLAGSLTRPRLAGRRRVEKACVRIAQS